MGGPALPLRHLSFAAAVAALALSATTATAAPTRAAAAPTVHRGQPATISVRTSTKAACNTSVTYSDGVIQDTGVKRPHAGRVVWTVRVPTNAALGAAHWHVACGLKFKASGAWIVAPVSGSTPPGQPAQPPVLVDKYGFRQRNSATGGSNVSYGLFLHNTSQTQDATNVYVLINFVTASGELAATVTKTVDVVYANTVWALGDYMALRTQEAVVKLEITVKVQSHRPTQAYTLPHFVNVRILPGQYDSGFVGEVDGEIVNDSSPETLQSANLSIVLLDANGNIVGGGSALSYIPLPSGSRAVFLAQSGFNSIPWGEATQAVISVSPTYSDS
jgi:hypothetical protein